ncbi:MAG: hypothetical protein ACI8XO_004256, partial [Verrucomicrobiales bacterium]
MTRKSKPTRPNSQRRWLAYAVTEGEAKAAKIHLRGDSEDLGEIAPREYLTTLGSSTLGDERSSGRLDLAHSQDARQRLDFAYHELFARSATGEKLAAFEDFARSISGAISGSKEEQDRETWKSYARVLL